MKKTAAVGILGIIACLSGGCSSISKYSDELAALGVGAATYGIQSARGVNSKDALKQGLFAAGGTYAVLKIVRASQRQKVQAQSYGNKVQMRAPSRYIYAPTNGGGMIYDTQKKATVNENVYQMDRKPRRGASMDIDGYDVSVM